MASTALLSYAKIIFYTHELKKERIIGEISNYDEFYINLFSNIISFDKYDYEIVKKTNNCEFYMNWHLDNALIVKNKKNTSNISKILSDTSCISISDRHTLYYYARKPVYSLIIYESNYGIDFTGGTLEFIDGVIIKPKRGLYILFNSNEVHRVNKILSGTRVNYLVKFYEKE